MKRENFPNLLRFQYDNQKVKPKENCASDQTCVTDHQALHSKRPWRAVLARRRWRSGYNAGGSPSFVETTAMNPQFHIQIPRASSGDRTGGGGGGGGGNSKEGGNAPSGKCHVVVRYGHKLSCHSIFLVTLTHIFPKAQAASSKMYTNDTVFWHSTSRPFTSSVVWPNDSLVQT